MKKFENPIMKIEEFNFTNIVTMSGAVDKAVDAVTAAEGGVTLDGKTLISSKVIKITL